MTRLLCGSVIHRLGSTDDPGTAGCLVRFPDLPDKLFVLTAGHVLVSSTARQYDPVQATGLPGQFGVLFGWTALDGEITVDAALVQVDPAVVSAEIGTLGAPTGTNLDPVEGMRLSIFAMGERRSGTVRRIGVDQAVTLVGPDFQRPQTYQTQILCDSFSVPGCSGAVALDEEGRAVGMVVAGDGNTFTLVTPIEACLGHPDWGDGPELEVLSAIPTTAKPPVIPAAMADPPIPPAPSDGTLSLPQRALNFFVAHGWTRAQGLGLVANIQAESSFKLNASGDHNHAFGLCQWQAPRQAEFAKKNHHAIQDATFEEQLEFVDFELRLGGETQAGKQLMREQTADGAARSVSAFYERPRDKLGSQETRARFARAFDATLV